MRNLFNRIVGTGVYPDTSRGQTDEIRVINSIKLHGAIMVWMSGLSVIYFMPAHWIFVLSILFIHLFAAILVFALNSRRKYNIARSLFIVDPAVLILGISAYFGLDVNFQYIALVCFLAFVFLFKSRTAKNLMTLAVFMFITLLGTLLLFDIQLTELSIEETASLRVASFSLSAGLVIMMGAVLFQSSSKRNARTEETLKESARDASILQTISDNMEEAIFKSSVQFGFVYVNEAFARMFGYESKRSMLETPPVNVYNSKAERDSLLARISRKGEQCFDEL